MAALASLLRKGTRKRRRVLVNLTHTHTERGRGREGNSADSEQYSHELQRERWMECMAVLCAAVHYQLVTCLAVRPHCLASSAFCSSVGYGWETCAVKKDRRAYTARSGSLERLSLTIGPLH